MTLADQPAERGVRIRLDGREHRPEERRQVMRPQRQPRHDAEAPAAAALEPPEQVRVRAGIGDPHRAVGGDHLGLEQARRRHPVGLREASEAAALDQARNAHGQAAAALDVAARLGRDGVVDLPPERTGLDRDRRLRRVPSRASGADECVVQRDGVHPARPDQQRIRRVGGALVAVAAALDDQAQIVLAGEVDRGDDVRSRAGRHRVGARPRRPGVDPAEGLRQPDLVAEVVGILQALEDPRARGALRRCAASGKRRADLDEPAPDIPVEPLQSASAGHPGSPGRTRAPARSATRRRRWRHVRETRSLRERRRCDRPEHAPSAHSEYHGISLPPDCATSLTRVPIPRPQARAARHRDPRRRRGFRRELHLCGRCDGTGLDARAYGAPGGQTCPVSSHHTCA